MQQVGRDIFTSINQTVYGGVPDSQATHAFKSMEYALDELFGLYGGSKPKDSLFIRSGCV